MLTLKNIFRIVNKIVGPILLVVLSYSIYTQVSSQSQLTQTITAICSFSISKALLLALVFVLMLLSFMIEAVKWKILVTPFQKITLLQATKNIFTGQAFAFTSVNDVGDFVGRVVHFKENKVQIGALSVLTTYSQIIVIIGFGLLSWAFNFYIIIQQFKISNWLSVFVLAACFLGFALGFYLYFNQQKFIHHLKKIKLLSWLHKIFEMVYEVDKAVLTKLLLYSIFKYVVYTVQYLIVLQLFGVEGTVMQLASLVALLLLAITIIPSIAFAELGIRGKLALVLFGILSNNAVAILMATVIVWLINRVIPAIIGTLFTSTIKLKY